MEGEKSRGLFGGMFGRNKKEDPQAKSLQTKNSGDLQTDESTPRSQGATNQHAPEKLTKKNSSGETSASTSSNDPKLQIALSKAPSNDSIGSGQVPTTSPKGDSKTMTNKMVKALQESKPASEGPSKNLAASKSTVSATPPLARATSFHQARLVDVIPLGDVMLETSIESRAIEVRFGLQEIDRGDNSSSKVARVLNEMQMLIDMMVARGQLSDAIILAQMQLEVAKKAVKFVRSLRASLPPTASISSSTDTTHKRSKTALPSEMMNSSFSASPALIPSASADQTRSQPSSYDDTEAKLFEWYSMAHYLLGSLLRIKKDYNEATAHLWDCIELRDTVKQLRSQSSQGYVDDIMGFAFGLLSVCYDAMGDQEKCFECHLKSLTECSGMRA